MVLIKGIQKTCLVDFEPYTSCVLFFGGCNFRCGYCHNPELVLNFNSIKTIEEEEIFSFLESRKNWIDGIVITGGEPTLYKDLPEFIDKIKKMGFLVKLDTNGSNPEMVKNLIEKKLVDYIAMDIKTSPENYGIVTGVNIDIEKIKSSADIIKNSEVEHEFRTTIVPGLVTKEDLIKIGEWLKGSKKYVIQNFREKADMIENRFKNISPHKKEELDEIREKMLKFFKEVVVKS